MQNWLNYLRYYLTLSVCKLSLFWFTNQDVRCQKFGNSGADWWLPEKAVTKSSIVYSFGVGEDVSFDLAVIRKCRVLIHAFDPTPRAIQYAKTQAKIEPRFRFHPWGIWNKNTSMKFYSPQNPQYVSHSIVNLQKTDSFFIAECKTLDTIMRKLRHTHIDVLKMDIEGAEHFVLSDMLEKGILPTVVCVEFDQPSSIISMFRMIIRLMRTGYSLVKQDNFNFTFYRV